MSITGSALTSGSALKIESTGANTTARNIVEIIQQHASAGADVHALLVDQDGIGDGILVDYDGTTGIGIRINYVGNDASSKSIGMLIDIDNTGNGDQIAIDVDQVDESKSYFARFNATTDGWVTTQDPTTDAPAEWIQIMVGANARLIPCYSKTT